jgi:hypothetical protein
MEAKTVSANRDPFYVVRDRITLMLAQLTEPPEAKHWNITKWEIREKQMHDLVLRIKVDIADVENTIHIVENYRSRFLRIDDAELVRARRRCTQ